MSIEPISWHSNLKLHNLYSKRLARLSDFRYERKASNTSQMRFLHISSGNLYGGVETLLRTLALHRSLCPDMLPEFALCFEGRLARELREASVPVHDLGIVRSRNPLSVRDARQRLRKLLRTGAFDLVICHMPWTQAIFGPVVRAEALPVVFWMHNPAAGRHWLERWARLTKPDLTLCNSHFTASTLSNLYRNSPFAILYYPVFVHHSDLSSSDKLKVRDELRTAPDSTVIIQMSRLEQWKGHLLHIEALGKLRDVPAWSCWQVGGAQRPREKRYLRTIQKAVERMGIADRVMFLGERNDVPRLLRAADIHCQPNTGPEPFGIVFIEALGAGLPVVTTAIGGALEIVDESCGVLVPPGNASALALALRHLINDRATRESLALRAPERASLLCDPAARMQELFTTLSALTR